MSVNKWNDVKCIDMGWTGVIYVQWFYFAVKWSEVKWSGFTVKFLELKVPCKLEWSYTEGMDYIVTMSFGYILYCGCFNLLCNVCVCVCVGGGKGGIFVISGYVCVGFVMCGCFGNMFTCIYCVLYCLYCVFCIVSFEYIYSYLY